MSDNFERQYYTNAKGEIRWVLAPVNTADTNDDVRQMRAEAVRLAKETGYNVMLTDTHALEDYADEIGVVLQNADDSAKLNIASGYLISAPEVAYAMMVGDDEGMWTSTIIADMYAAVGSKSTAYVQMIPTPTPSDDVFLVNLNEMASIKSDEAFAALAGITQENVTGLQSSDAQWRRFIIEHEIGHVDLSERGDDLQKLREERNSDLIAMRNMRLSEQFNNQNGFNAEVKAARSIGVFQSVDITESGNVIPNYYSLTNTVTDDGQLRAPDMDDWRIFSTSAKVLNTVYLVEGLVSNNDTNVTPRDFDYVLNRSNGSPELVSAEDNSRLIRNLGYDVLNETEGTPPVRKNEAIVRMYEDVAVLREAGAFTSPESVAIVDDYLEGMRRYTNIPEQANLEAARERMAGLLTPEHISMMNKYTQLKDTVTSYYDATLPSGLDIQNQPQQLAAAM